MQYGICNLSIVPLRNEPSETSLLLSQVLYGDTFKVLEQRKNWSRIRLAFDNYEGWINNKQYKEISEDEYSSIHESVNIYSTDLVEFVRDKKQTVISNFHWVFFKWINTLKPYLRWQFSKWHK